MPAETTDTYPMIPQEQSVFSPENVVDDKNEDKTELPKLKEIKSRTDKK